MLIKRPARIKPSEITDEALYRDRRRFLELSSKSLLALGAAAVVGCDSNEAVAVSQAPPASAGALRSLGALKSSAFSTSEPSNSFDDISSYNNFYEFGTRKTDPANNSGSLRTDPWSIEIEGAVEKPGRIALEDLMKPHALEERIYRLRCVEAWSMVVPWVGIPLGDVLKRFKPTSNAKYVEFTTLYDPEQMPGQDIPVLDWPYVEGLRIDEAVHPLTILGVGLYGKVLPNQCGAPIRLVVPWKYGFKSIKSIVKIRLLEREPKTSWNVAGPREYGFYANVNPDVDHPRWSQNRERRIGSLLKQKTLPFNGYADDVASLYRGMDLRKFF
ncbi:mononuclear molybdenum enzyme YedY [Solemya pervernicosa gill symbiont]|uniref:Protein-methionine-sulfoxide reductase catalytic subunit MsrP n=2 Tax=Gammaproteobacteria incertae sedis TaxID=118884 RepID=A0A1T2L4F7_9GAMM|nr:protein-methionine-sulfoxide reductase catalytic subunit MsrP [Candidatus Reidiella endopervernicosa]OOZ39979.1 mononuclear molybdenum enzyme YedY [Solemya pervernicosa gill symbiont]QKQ27779.1 protein-methionine-sulfoxide reductase catalytic subunit MsrP [Candidatus Reidiella endopervernicosa]